MGHPIDSGNLQYIPIRIPVAGSPGVKFFNYSDGISGLGDEECGAPSINSSFLLHFDDVGRSFFVIFYAMSATSDCIAAMLQH